MRHDENRRGDTWYFLFGGSVFVVGWVGGMLHNKSDHVFERSERGCVVEVGRGARDRWRKKLRDQ